MAPDKTSDVLVTGSKWRSGIGLDICCPNRALNRPERTVRGGYFIAPCSQLISGATISDQKDEAPVPGNSLRFCSPWSNLK